MKTIDPKAELDDLENCALKIVSDNVISMISTINTIGNLIEAEEEQEPRCQNGVCSLNWKPRRAA